MTAINIPSTWIQDMAISVVEVGRHKPGTEDTSPTGYMQYSARTCHISPFVSVCVYFGAVIICASLFSNFVFKGQELKRGYL